MPARRDADGNIHEQPTTFNHGNDDALISVNGATALQDGQTHRPGRAVSSPQDRSDSAYEAKTVLAGSVRSATHEVAGSAEERRTRVYRPGRSAIETRDDSIPQNNPMDDPPVGWLVVVDGPGKGSVVTIGNGVNSIGRDASERITLDFGDEMISRNGHSIVTYDPRGKRFYIQHGGGTNLTYINDTPVLAHQELEPFTHILIGATTLRFIPLCGPAFDWDQDPDSR